MYSAQVGIVWELVGGVEGCVMYRFASEFGFVYARMAWVLCVVYVHRQGQMCTVGLMVRIHPFQG